MLSSAKEVAICATAQGAGRLAAASMETDRAYAVVIRRDMSRGEMKGYNVRVQMTKGGNLHYATEYDAERLLG